VKRFGNLYPSITNFENLFRAAKKAQKGKRFRDPVLEFNFDLANNLLILQEELIDQTYQPEGYHTFVIHDPKERLISATAYRDRIVHHALCNIIIPLLEPSFILNSYANRIGFGTHKALRQFAKYARSSRYVLQCDIKKYFPSIDRPILKSMILKKIKCPDTLWLIDLILDNSNNFQINRPYQLEGNAFEPMTETKGLPIGNLTSQFFANLYLNDFDHFIKENLKAKKYLRYVDDFALFSNDLAFLKDARVEIHAYLASLKLEIHPIKSQLFATKEGASFVGFRVLPHSIRVRSRSIQFTKRRIKHYRLDKIKLRQSIDSWDSHLRHGDTWRLRKKLFRAFGIFIAF
jgi:retron-type reverse transcriptase